MITVTDLTKRFASGPDQVLAVERLSFIVSAGEVYGLLGPNGAGKTTTLRMILGLLEPTSGSVAIDGFQVSRQPDEVKRRVGFVSASAGLYQWLTPRETMQFFADVYGVAIEESEPRIAELIRLMDLSAFVDRRSATLSTGQAQRVNLARALVHDPPIVLMDEPTRGLDVVGSRVVFDYVAHLREEGKAVVVCTHRLDEAQRLCDRFGLLHRGSLRHEGTLAELRERIGPDSLVDMFEQLLNTADEAALS